MFGPWSSAMLTVVFFVQPQFFLCRYPTRKVVPWWRCTVSCNKEINNMYTFPMIVVFMITQCLSCNCGYHTTNSSNTWSISNHICIWFWLAWTGFHFRKTAKQMPIRPIIIIIIIFIIIVIVVVVIIIIIIIITSIIFAVVVIIIIIINRVYNLYWSFVFQSCIKSLDNSFFTNKANLDLTAATGLVKFTQIGFKSTIFQPVWPCNLVNDLEKKQ